MSEKPAKIIIIKQDPVTGRSGGDNWFWKSIAGAAIFVMVSEILRPNKKVINK